VGGGAARAPSPLPLTLPWHSATPFYDSCSANPVLRLRELALLYKP